MWFQAGSGDTKLASDLGAVEGTVVTEYRELHCADQPTCVTVVSPLRSRVLMSRAMLTELIDTQHAVMSDSGDLITIQVDHVGEDGGAEWMYRLAPVRWSDTDPPGYGDPDLLLGVWPD